MNQVDGPTAHVVLEGLRYPTGEGGVESQITLKFPIASTLHAGTLSTAQRDCEILAAKMSAHPDEFADLLTRVNGGDLRGAVDIARRIGITESDFKQDGGGFLPVLVGAAVVLAIVLYASDAS